MNKAFAAVGAGIIAIFVFFQVFTALGGMVPGMEQSELAGDYAQGPQMRGCVRSLVREGASDHEAQAACGCMFREFDKRGLSLWDAADQENVPLMSELSRDCATVHGISVPELGAADAGWGD